MFKLLKFKVFKYTILFISLTLLLNIIVILHWHSHSKLLSKKVRNHDTDTSKEHSSPKINKLYLNNIQKSRHSNVSNEIHQEILNGLDALDKYFFEETKSYFIQNKFKNLVNELKITGQEEQENQDTIQLSHANELNSWLLFPSKLDQNKQRKYFHKLISKMSSLLCRSNVVLTSLLQKGTQLKLLLTLEGKDHIRAKPHEQLQAVFKPKVYENSETFPIVYEGRDRHYGELIGFLLSILLGMYRAPLTVLTQFKMSKLLSTASDTLNATYFRGPKSTSCIQGRCTYCTKEDALCADVEASVYGALLLYVEQKELKLVPHPYRREYVTNKSKAWESDDTYCLSSVVKRYDQEFILDIVDIAVFDFLLQNGDRHHLDKVNEEDSSKTTFLLFDNGKSFGNHALDFLDILAPLYQCCTLRSSTYNTLVQLRGGLMTRVLKQMSKQSVCSGEQEEVLSDEQWRGMERRLTLIFATVNYCLRKQPDKTVLVS